MSRRCVVLCAVTLLAASASPAATFTVTSTAESGPGTLRQAILDANANPGSDEIRFAVTGGSVTPLPDVTDAVDIAGGSAGTALVFRPGSSGSVLRDMFLQGLRVETGVSGMTIAGNTIEGSTTIAGDANLIGGTAAGEGNDFAFTQTLATGLVSVTGNDNEFYGNTFALMSISFAQGNRVGSLGHGNVFKGKTTHPSCASPEALVLRSAATIVEGNVIRISGCSVMPALHVIQASPPGGPSRITGNSIYNGVSTASIWVEGPVTGVEILGNPVISTGIRLTGGANHMQPAPQLTGALWQPHGVTVSGIVHGAPQTPHIVELYGVLRTDGYLWLPTLLATFEVTTDALGTAGFTRTTPAVPFDDIRGLLATATNASTRDTSEMGVEIAVAAIAGNPVPTVSQWALLALALTLAALGLRGVR